MLHSRIYWDWSLYNGTAAWIHCTSDPFFWEYLICIFCCLLFYLHLVTKLNKSWTDYFYGNNRHTTECLFKCREKLNCYECMHSGPYVKNAKFSLCFMGMIGRKTFFILFLFYILCIVRAKILATIFLSLVRTNIIYYETVKFVYRMTHKSLFAEYFIAALVCKWFNQAGLLTQFFAVHCTHSEIWTWAPTLSCLFQKILFSLKVQGISQEHCHSLP